MPSIGAGGSSSFALIFREPGASLAGEWFTVVLALYFISPVPGGQKLILYAQRDPSRLNLADDQSFPCLCALSDDIGCVPTKRLNLLPQP